MGTETAVRHSRRPFSTIRTPVNPAVTPSKAWSRASTDAAYNAFSRMASAMALWALLGFGLDRLFGTWPTLFAIGLVVGIHVGAFLIYTVQKAAEEQNRAA